ncbi:MAG: type I-E CRISPR-associated protein Cse2/CasB [Lentilactobacillus diolivorans]|jgi:CRISPR system Cascade subunit CasB|nr:type I-E CRISPR-associated protein Cse2/CasB [Lentilactobacillus diolivorans]
MTTDIDGITFKIIQTLYGNGNPDKAVLASVRSASSITSQRAQKVWPILMANLPSDLLSKSGRPTRAETAIYSAVRLYAIHQQGKDAIVCGNSLTNDPKDGVTLFEALANLRRNADIRVALDRRIQPLLETTNIDSVINSITHLVAILKANNGTQKIDYPRLAKDLYWFQSDFKRANEVRLLWGQQYFWVTNQTTKIEGKQ